MGYCGENQRKDTQIEVTLGTDFAPPGSTQALSANTPDHKYYGAAIVADSLSGLRVVAQN